MDLLKYLSPMKNMPERFSNLVFFLCDIGFNFTE